MGSETGLGPNPWSSDNDDDDDYSYQFMITATLVTAMVSPALGSLSSIVYHRRVSLQRTCRFLHIRLSIVLFWSACFRAFDILS